MGRLSEVDDDMVGGGVFAIVSYYYPWRCPACGSVEPCDAVKFVGFTDFRHWLCGHCHSGCMRFVLRGKMRTAPPELGAIAWLASLTANKRAISGREIAGRAPGDTNVGRGKAYDLWFKSARRRWFRGLPREARALVAGNNMRKFYRKFPQLEFDHSKVPTARLNNLRLD